MSKPVKVIMLLLSALIFLISCDTMSPNIEDLDLDSIIADMTFPYTEGDFSYSQIPNRSELIVISYNTSTNQNLTIPNKVNNIPVTAIADQCFFDDQDLATIFIPDSVSYIGTNTFRNCSNLTEVNVDPKNNYFYSDQGVLYLKNQQKLLIFPAGKGGFYTIPYGTQLIDDKAFINCNYLNTLYITETVSSISLWTFNFCSNLNSITIIKDSFNQQTESNPLNFYRNPDNLFVASIFGKPQMNFVTLSVKDEGGKAITYNNDLSIQLEGVTSDLIRSYVGGTVTLGVRSEDIILTSTLPSINGATATVSSFEVLNNDYYLNITCTNGTTLTVLADPTDSYNLGDTVFFTFDLESLIYFRTSLTIHSDGKEEYLTIK